MDLGQPDSPSVRDVVEEAEMSEKGDEPPLCSLFEDERSHGPGNDVGL